MTLSEAAAGAVTDERLDVPSSGAALAANEGDGDDVHAIPKIGEESLDEFGASDLFDPATTGRVVLLWILTPTISAVASFVLFRFVPLP